MHDRANELRRIYLPSLFEKGSSASQSPQHEATHGSVHERFATRTEPLIVLAHILRLWQIQAKERSTTQLEATLRSLSVA